MAHPIIHMIDQACRCRDCGALPPTKCDCRRKRDEETLKQKPRRGKIHLRCPKCGAVEINSARQGQDPRTAAILELTCPTCGKGDKEATMRYLDINGNEVA